MIMVDYPNELSLRYRDVIVTITLQVFPNRILSWLKTNQARLLVGLGEPKGKDGTHPKLALNDNVPSVCFDDFAYNTET